MPRGRWRLEARNEEMLGVFETCISASLDALRRIRRWSGFHRWTVASRGDDYACG